MQKNHASVSTADASLSKLLEHYELLLEALSVRGDLRYVPVQHILQIFVVLARQKIIEDHFVVFLLLGHRGGRRRTRDLLLFLWIYHGTALIVAVVGHTSDYRDSQ